MGSKIATGAVGTAQLASNVLTSINQGVTAYNNKAAAPRLYNFGVVQPSGKMTAGSIISSYTVSDACNIATAKIFLNGCAFNLSGGNTNVNNLLATAGTIPAQYRPSISQETLIYVVGGDSGRGVCLFYAAVNTDGKIGIYHTNYADLSHTADVYAVAMLVWYYGEQRQN